jgi:hypothetical protein
MKQQWALAVLLAASAVGMIYRVQRDFRQLSSEAAVASSPDFKFVPPLLAYDLSGKPVVLPLPVRSVALLPLHQADDALQTRIWKKFLEPAGSSKGILVIGVLADGDSSTAVAGLDGAPWFRCVAYANYAPLMIVADLDRRNEIAILNDRGMIRRRIPRPTDARQLEAAFQ